MINVYLLRVKSEHDESWECGKASYGAQSMHLDKKNLVVALDFSTIFTFVYADDWNMRILSRDHIKNHKKVWNKVLKLD